MQLKNSFLILLLSGAICIGCTDDATQPPLEASGPIMPLATGNSWTYKGSTLDTSGAIKEEGTYTSSVLRDTLIHSEKWFIVNEFVAGSNDIIMQGRTDGLWFYDTPQSFLFFKYPGQVHSTYPFGSTSDRWTIVSTSEKLITAGKTFTCYHYRYIPQDESEVNFHLAPGVGLIKFSNIRTYPSGKQRIFLHELQSYTLK